MLACRNCWEGLGEKIELKALDNGLLKCPYCGGFKKRKVLDEMDCGPKEMSKTNEPGEIKTVAPSHGLKRKDLLASDGYQIETPVFELLPEDPDIEEVREEGPDE